jgi:formiminotetrahydrofolate cyclodeaminase
MVPSPFARRSPASRAHGVASALHGESGGVSASGLEVSVGVVAVLYSRTTLWHPVPNVDGCTVNARWGEAAVLALGPSTRLDVGMADERVTTRQSTLAEWLGRLAEPVGDPGGGAAAGLMLAVSAALTSMVAGYEGRNAGALSGRRAERLRERAVARRAAALEAADSDALASRALGDALRMPAGADRDAAVRDASLAATESSVRLGDLVLASIDDLVAVAAGADPVLIADAAVAIAAARAALAGSRANAASDLADLARHDDPRTSPDDDLETRRAALTSALARLDEGVERLEELEASLADRLSP